MSAIAWELPEEPRHDKYRDLFEDQRRLYREDGRFSDELKGLIGEVRRVSAKARGFASVCDQIDSISH
jgi:hypothetical protein